MFCCFPGSFLIAAILIFGAFSGSLNINTAGFARGVLASRLFNSHS